MYFVKMTVSLSYRLMELYDFSYAGIDLIAAFYGCLYAGCVPITVRPPHPQNIATTLPTVKMIVEVRLKSSLPMWSDHFRIKTVIKILDITHLQIFLS